MCEAVGERLVLCCRGAVRERSCAGTERDRGADRAGSLRAALLRHGALAVGRGRWLYKRAAEGRRRPRRTDLAHADLRAAPAHLRPDVRRHHTCTVQRERHDAVLCERRGRQLD